jgi:phosphoglycerate dehydrogenase-like enzyme
MKILVSFDLDKTYVNRIQSCIPDANVQSASQREALLSAITDAEVLLAGRFAKEMFSKAMKLRWVQTVSAGVDRFLFPEFVSSDVILTNARGIHYSQVSDHVLAMILAFSRRLNELIRFQQEKKWARIQCDELQGKSLGIIGLGSIGSEIARKAKCFGMRVVSVDRDVGKRIPFVDEFLGLRDLRRLLKQSDFVVLSVPLTPESDGMIGEAELSAMKRDAILINVSRGRVIQEKALVKALKEGQIGGAGLDVFEEEPLPPSSELWLMKNVIATPHVAGSTPHYWDRVCDIFCENLRRYTSGQPLINRVDKRTGY